jgi:hypothetical protein
MNIEKENKTSSNKNIGLFIIVFLSVAVFVGMIANQIILNIYK